MFDDYYELEENLYFRIDFYFIRVWAIGIINGGLEGFVGGVGGRVG